VINYLADKAEYLQLPEDALDEAVLDNVRRLGVGAGEQLRSRVLRRP